jgi:chromosome segregation ATPase
LNREEKRQLVLQLYNEGKTMREIAKEVHMSFGDIGIITKKLNEQLEPKKKETSKESQALKLFRKQRNPVDVAISLDLSPSKAAGIYKQFWKLKGLYNLLYLYEQVKPDISLLIKIHDVVRKYNLTKKDIINIANYADKHLYLKDQIEKQKWQLDSILNQKDDVNNSLQTIKKEHRELSDKIVNYNEISLQKNSYIENLDDEIEKLEKQISKLKNSDEYYTKFEQFAREKLNSVMKDIRWIVPLAIDAVIESLRRDSFKQMIINDEICDQANRDKLLDSCELLFDKLLKRLMEGTLQNRKQDINGLI